MGKAVKATRNAGVVVNAIKPDDLKRIREAFGVAEDTELARLAIAAEFIAAGQSIRAAVAAVIKANGGRPVNGFSKSSLGRYWQIANVMRRDDAPSLTAAQYKRVAMAYVNLANVGANLSEHADVAIKGASTGAQYAAAITAAAKREGQRHYRELTAPTSRKPHGKALDAGKGDKGDKGDAPTDAPRKVTEADERSRFADAGILALARELDARLIVKGRGKVTPDRDLLEVFTSIVSKLEAIVGAEVGADA